MAVVNINLTCELQEAVKVQYIDGVLFSQDNQANKINVTVLDGGEPATISGTVSANIVRSDGGTVAATGGSITGNVASITLPAAAYAVPGVVSIVVKLTASGVVTTIAAFVANMYRASTDTAIDPGTVIPSIQTLISQINAAVASIPADYSALWTKLAPAFSTSASYVAGQYVTYNSGLYRFNTTHTGDWSSSDVTAVNLGGEISDLKNAINGIMTFGTLINDSYVKTNGEIASYNNWARTDYLDVSRIATMTLGFYESSGSEYNCFYDEDKEFISSFTVGATDTEISVPSNAYYVIFSNARLRMAKLAGTFITRAEKKANDALSTFASYLPVSISKYTQIPASTDYDNLANGVHYCASASAYDDLGENSHRPPRRAAHMLIVIDVYGSSRKGNIAFYGNYIYFRSQGSSTWTDWQLVANNADIDKMNRLFYQYCVFDAIDIAGLKTGNSDPGMTITYNADGTYTFSGTSQSTFSCNIINSNSSLPDCIIPGEKYLVQTGGCTVPIQLYLYNSGGSALTSITEDTTVTIPSDTIGIILRFRIQNGTSASETVKVTMSHMPYWIDSIGGGGGIINNTYNITTSPTITTDTNGWLQAIDTDTEDETGKTDMTGAIMSMLTDTGYCHLGEGIFYVSGSIDMPAHSMLCGCGDKSEIRLLQTTTTGYCVKMRECCTIRDVAFSGAYSDITPSSEGTRTGIRFSANYDGTTDGTTAYQTKHCMIDNVWIRNFSGSGLLCHNTSINYAKGLYVSNAYIYNCFTGINIDYYSEFNKFTNVCVSWCYYGCVNNGGNNVFTSCTFHAINTGFKIDGSKPNPGHGVINGCTFCHIGSNSGKAIDISGLGAGFGFVIANCQIWYNSVYLTNSSGILFDGCEFGRGTTGAGATIVISGGSTVLFNGCMFMNDETYAPDITITNNTKVKFANCYGAASGNAITAS